MKSKESYNHLAKFYSHLMRGIDYGIWADYISVLAKELKKKNPNVLEIACGSGNIARNLKKEFKNYIVSDLSASMMNQLDEENIAKVCCDMTALPFKRKFDFVFSTFDSVNYLLTKEKFTKFLAEVSSVLNNEGILTFDVSLENNSLRYQKYLNRKGKLDGIKYIQHSKYNEKSRIHYNHFEITLADGSKYEEIHKQKIYRFEDYFLFIENSDFFVSGCYETFTFTNANAETERAQFILKKKV
jgi:ubiquinone/menaquinone biosynthesis C-methylase UbiE